MNFLYENNRIYLVQNGKIIVELIFPAVDANTVKISRTFVDDTLRGQDITTKLMTEFVKIAQDKALKVIPECSYVAHWFTKHC